MPMSDGPAGLGQAFYRDWAGTTGRASVVLLHGYGEHSGLYHRLAHRLNDAGIRMWAIDAPGHGLSAGPRGRPTNDAYVAAGISLIAIAREAAPDVPLVLLGHSMGSIASATIAVRHPELIDGLVLTGPPLEGLSDELRDGFAEIVLSEDPFYVDELAHDPLVAWTEQVGGPAADGSDVLGELAAGLPRLDRPALLICGELDPIAPPAMVREAAGRMTAAEMAEIPGGHHDILNDTSHREVADRIVAFTLARTRE